MALDIRKSSPHCVKGLIYCYTIVWAGAEPKCQTIRRLRAQPPCLESRLIAWREAVWSRVIQCLDNSQPLTLYLPFCASTVDYEAVVSNDTTEAGS